MRYIFVMLVVGLSQARTWGVPENSPTIQGALDLATSGDTVLVEAGTYPENLVLPAVDLVLRSAHGPEVTQIHALAGSVVTIDQGNSRATVVEGFSVSGGLGTPYFLNGLDRGGIGGGFLILGDSSPTIRSNWISGNVAARPAGVGGGIFVWGGNPVIQGNWIVENSAHYGGGIFLFHAQAAIVDNILDANASMPAHNGYANGTAGGIRVFESQAVIRNNTFARNQSHSDGAALAVSEPTSRCLLTDNLFVENQGGLAVVSSFSALTTTCCNLLWQNAGGDGWQTDVGIVDMGDNRVEDPRFCADGGWPWALEEDSPCRPVMWCGWIGASTADCDATALPDDGGDAQQRPATTWMLGLPNPNPGNPRFTLPVLAPRSGRVQVEIFNVAGQRVAILWSGPLAAGRHEFTWDGGGMPSGVYLARLTAPGKRHTRKLTLVK